MTFTYDPTLADDVSMVRFQVNDTVVNAGPRPTSSNDPSTTNFADEEISATLVSVGDDVNKTIATLFNILATQWTKYATSITVGPYKEETYRMCQQYLKLAEKWALSSGLGGSAFSSGVIRRSRDTDSRFVT